MAAFSIRKFSFVQFLIKHSLLCVYILMFGGIVFGSFCDSGVKYLPNLMLVLGSLLGVYLLLVYVFKNRNWNLNFPVLDKISIKKVEILLLVSSALVVVTHYIAIGHIPVLTALLSSDYNEIVNIRKVIAYETPVLNWYLCHIFLKACFPVLTFYFFYTKRVKMGWAILLVGMFYGFSMMQKSYALSIPLPTLILFVLRLKIWSSLIIIGLIVLQIFGLLYITNPDLRDQMQVFENETAHLNGSVVGVIKVKKKAEVPINLKSNISTAIDSSSLEKVEVKIKEKTKSNLKNNIITAIDNSSLEKVEVKSGVNDQSVLKKVVSGTIESSNVKENEIKIDENYLSNLRKGINTSSSSITNRVFLLPGAMVNSWFKVIPEKMPFLHGRGYRFLAPFHGKKGYADYNQALYRLIYPGFAKRGFQGNVNVASFMYEYANFGRWGLVLGGILIGLTLFFIEKIFEGFTLVKLALNGMFVFFLSSIAYTTLLFSGGWVFTILLFLILKKRFKNEY